MTPIYKKGFPNLNYKEMRKICSAKPDQLAAIYGLIKYDTIGGRYWFKDNGKDSKVLAVAHLDSRRPFIHFAVPHLRMDTLIYCPTLDDRLGAYVILDYLPKMKIKYDILLTEGEEVGNSTAQFFKPPTEKEYNWIFMFDRAGTDVAMYDYKDDFTTKLLKEYDLEATYGQYSCIAELEELGVKGFNFGAGYHNNHSDWAFASKIELMENIKKFVSFYLDQYKLTMRHIPKYLSYLSEYDNAPWTSDDEKSKADLIKEKFRKKKVEKEAKQAEWEEIGLETSNLKFNSETNTYEVEEPTAKDEQVAEFLFQSLEQALPELPLPLYSKLYHKGIISLGELVGRDKIDLLNSDFTKNEVESIIEALDEHDLSFSTNVEKYGIIIRDLPKAKKGDTVVMSFVDGYGASNKAKKLEENGQCSAVVKAQCMECNEEFDLEITENQKSSSLYCPKCRAEKEAKPTKELIGRMLSIMPLKRSERDKTVFVTDKNGRRWEEQPIESAAKLTVGFTV
jgi:hypothetical protein